MFYHFKPDRAKINKIFEMDIRHFITDEQNYYIYYIFIMQVRLIL